MDDGQYWVIAHYHREMSENGCASVIAELNVMFWNEADCTAVPLVVDA